MRRMRLGIFLLVTMLALLTVGCAPTEKDAEKFVKEFMDYVSGEQSDHKIFDAEMKEELRKGVIEGLEEVTDGYLEEGEEVSSDLKARVADAVIEAMKKLKYTVGSAKKTEDGFDVPIMIEPLLLYEKFEENLNREFAEYAPEIKGEIEVSKYLELVIETMVDTVEKASQNPSYGEPVEFIVPLIVVDDQLQVKDENNTIEKLGEQMTLGDVEFWAREKDPGNFKGRAEKILEEAISGEYDGSFAVCDNMVALVCHLYYENNMLYTQEEAKQEWLADGDPADLAEEKAAFLCAVQKMSKYECLNATEKNGDPAIAVSVTKADPQTYLDNLNAEISASITQEDVRRFASEDEFNAYYNKVMFEEANKRINEMVYKEPEEYAIRFSEDSDIGVYIANSEDVLDILIALTLLN